jgi:hypothetical protein
MRSIRSDDVQPGHIQPGHRQRPVGAEHHVFGLVLSLLIGWAATLVPGLASAAELPSPDALEARLRQAPAVVEVRNPHLALGLAAPVLAFRGFPASAVLDALLGSNWRADGAGEIEFRAADGYRSAIPAANFLQYRAWLVYERADGAAFATDNVYQDKRDIPLGPWYLVWDNIGSPDLIPLGDHYWPYQVVGVSFGTEP